jgi:hypothetical protein
VADVIAQDFLLDAAKRRPRCRELGYDAVEALDAGVFGRVVLYLTGV